MEKDEQFSPRVETKFWRIAESALLSDYIQLSTVESVPSINIANLKLPVN
jgi:hypothetical protein